MDVSDPSIEGVTWWAYVQRHRRSDSNTDVSKKVGVTPSSVSRWAKETTPDPGQAAAFARAYGRPVLEAFVAAGYLTPEEANERPSARPSLAELSDDDLLGEVRRRMQGGQSWGAGKPSGPEDDDGGSTAVDKRRLTMVEPADEADEAESVDLRDPANNPYLGGKAAHTPKRRK